MSFDIASLSRTGGRKANEDYADFLQTSESSCWVLADGLGGHRGGAIASKTVVEAALASFRNRPEVSVEAVHAHVAHAQAVLMAAQEQDPSLAQMRSTIVVLVSSDRDAVWGHVGDSRLYHVRGGQIVERTRDHSVSQALVDGGQIDAHEQGAHEDRSRLLKCLGKDAETSATVSGPHALARGDAFLICTDGFWEALDDMSMELDFAGADDAAAWLDRLEARLRRHIGPTHDNYTATAIRITSAVPPLAVPHDPRRPVQAPWRHADNPPRATDVPDATDRVDVMGAAGRVLPAPVRLRLARMPRPRQTTLAAAAVVMLALAAAAVWQRHGIAAWVKAVVTRNVRVPDQPGPQSEPPPQPNSSGKSNAAPSSAAPSNTAKPKDPSSNEAPPKDGEKPSASPSDAPPPSATPPATATPSDAGASGASPAAPSGEAAPGAATRGDATPPDGETPRRSKPPKSKHVSGKNTPRGDQPPSPKGAETPRIKP